MEFATGGTLRDLIKKNQPLRPLPERLADAAGAIAGLAAIHGAGIVHRDVKPDNMLRMDDGRLVLSDFGLATDLPDSTMVSVFVGTPHYMAPEVREGDPATTRSDVWSLGVVLHEIFFGKRPERRSTRSAAGVSKGSTRTTSSTIERAMLALCERCLADDPAERPEDASAVGKLFEALADRRTRSSGRRESADSLHCASLRLRGRGVIGSRGRNQAAGDRATAAATSPGDSAAGPDGEPADWTQAARRSSRSVPGHVHCFSMVDDEHRRASSGERPRTAEDVDVAFGHAAAVAAFVPETYCGRLSGAVARRRRAAVHWPARRRRRPRYDCRQTLTARDAKSVTPGSDPRLAHERRRVRLQHRRSARRRVLACRR